MNTEYNGEFNTDKYIRETFFPDFNYKGIMVEVGAGPTVYYSMSKHFRDNGWRCICIEPNKKFVNAHKDLGHEIYECACSDFDGESNFTIINTHGYPEDIEGLSISSFNPRQSVKEHYSFNEVNVNVVKLNTLLERIKIKEFDFLSIDTEGYELEVMRGFSPEIYKPKIILLENVWHDLEYVYYMNKIGYKLNKQIEYNYIFTKN